MVLGSVLFNGIMVLSEIIVCTLLYFQVMQIIVNIGKYQISIQIDVDNLVD